MRHKLENEVLTIFLEGELNSFTAEDAEKDIDEIIKGSTFKSIVLDMEKLTYLSSAGIRIIVRLKLKYKDTSIVNVPDDIYAIFEMVGFTGTMKIEKLK